MYIDNPARLCEDVSRDEDGKPVIGKKKFTVTGNTETGKNIFYR